MIDLLHVGILIPTALGLCCTVGDRRSRSIALWLPAGVMGLAMVDMSLGLALLPGLGWAGILVMLALAGGVRQRLRGSAVRPTGGHAAMMSIHRSGALLLMAVLLAAMEIGPGAASPTRGSHGHAGASGILAVLAVGGTIVFTAGTVILIRKLVTRTGDRDLLSGAEAGLMGLSLGLMGLAAIA